MKNLNILWSLLLISLLSSTLVSAQDDFCPGNFFDNGDFEIGTPTNTSNNITLAAGWDKIWNGSSEADYYDETSSAIGGASGAPTPPDGDYGSLWIDNRVLATSTWREGLLNQLVMPVPINTGTYSFSFDIACLHGWGDAEIGVYGVYDPAYPGTYVYPTAPTSSHVPTNANLYSASGLLQEIDLLGTVMVPSNCDDAKQNVTFTFDSNTLSLSGDITHIVITRSETVIAGSKYVAVDNFCMALDDDTQQPNDEGAFCCDGKNLATNGNFEAGDTGFSSSYTQSTSVYPGEYNVTNDASLFGTTVTDHSFCTDSSLYPTNDQFMVVNGKTQQASTSVIYEQTLTGLRQGQRYRFCANFKNLPQCTFDILPTVFMNAGTSSSGGQIINTDETDPCDWQSVEMTFTAGSSSEVIRILLDEGGNGDGNDLAIDDIGVFELGDPDIAFTLQNQQNPSQITASVNTIDPSDDALACDEYYWWVAKNTSATGIAVDFSTFAFGNNTGSMLPPAASVPGPNWDLTTTFPGYTFNPSTLYIVGLYTPECECNGEGFEYQMTFSSRSESFDMTPAQKQEVIDAILYGLDFTDQTEEDSPAIDRSVDSLSLYPNPAQGEVTLQHNTAITRVEIYSLSGQLVKQQSLEDGTHLVKLPISDLNQGVYILTVYDRHQKQQSRRLIKQ